MVKAKDVAKYFLSVSEPSTPWAITPLKLQKLVYYAQGWYMAIEKKPLFDDDLKAWDHGPVVPELYQDYKKYGYLTIPVESFYNNKKNGKEIFTEKQLEILESVWESYGEYDGKFLEEMTHQEDPWLYTNKNQTIEKNVIKKYFGNLIV
ncbi:MULTISPECIES: Panacea domain-containing protein [Priestia]|uniref:Panacea domain-containing protein n=1 Tax=Priestia TaxID=2800373 RepID=UPI001C8DCBB7|nr:type II toxin-antitoxin system antitoxin SocA domain-containing protein [Priestia aryabhattai]MBY0213847.1 SocA family protein [Priestia aryabhattai]